jgi:hypothetical protein
MHFCGLFHRDVKAWAVILGLLAAGFTATSSAQDLAPRAYVITPLHSNAFTMAWSWFDGSLSFNNAVPITDAKGTYNVPIASLYHSFSLFERSANFVVALPYGVGSFSGDVQDQHRSAYRSGLLDLSARLSVNLIGGPAMDVPEFVKWKQKRILGASLKMIFPTGQYDPKKLVNWGINRWAFKPEIGYSQRFESNWLVDAYAGVWFYTTNPAYYNIPVPAPQTQSPIGSFEGHLSYDVTKWKIGSARLHPWASLDGNFWWGGTTALNGIRNLNTRQTSSRIGGTVSLPYNRHQSFKVSYSDGTYIRFGGNYQNLQVAWQYSWLGRPK